MCQNVQKSPEGPWEGEVSRWVAWPPIDSTPGALAWQSPAQPGWGHVGLDCPPHPEASQIPNRLSVQEQDKLGMKSQLEGAGLGLPLQGGAWGHDPGSREPRREDAFREEAAENTHTAASRGREENKLQETKAGLVRSLGGRFLGTDATLQAAHGLQALRPGPACLPPRGPEQVVPDMDERGKLGLGCQGAHSTWGVRAESGTTRG